jgi:hypothetical protein
MAEQPTLMHDRDPIVSAAWFVANQPGGAARLFDRHWVREDGDCNGCGVYRPVRWPCVLIYIARRAEEFGLARVLASTDLPTDPPHPAASQRPIVTAPQQRESAWCAGSPGREAA